MKNNVRPQRDDPQRALENVLADIKALLVLLLLKGGATQAEIAKALGSSQGTVSRQFRLGGVEPFEAAIVNTGNGGKG